MYTYDEFTVGKLTIRIDADEFVPWPMKDMDFAGTMIVVGNTNDYDHLSTGDLSDYGIYHAYGEYVRVTDAGNELTIDQDDIPAHIERVTGGVCIEFSHHGNSQSDWFDALWIMDRAKIIDEVSQYNRKRIKPPKGRVNTWYQPDGTIGSRVEYFNHDTQEWQTEKPAQPRFRVTASDRDKARDILRSEAGIITQYLQQDVWQYTIEDHEGEHLDSLCGMYGIDYAIQEARDAAESYASMPQYQDDWEDPQEPMYA